MSGAKNTCIAKLISMKESVVSKAMPTGVVMRDGLPSFVYNKVTTKLLQDIADLRLSILTEKE